MIFFLYSLLRHEKLVNPTLIKKIKKLKEAKRIWRKGEPYTLLGTLQIIQLLCKTIWWLS